MLHLMRQALADTAATGQDDRPAAGGDVDMVDQGAASAPCCQELDFTFMSEAHAARSARTRWLRPACTRA